MTYRNLFTKRSVYSLMLRTGASTIWRLRQSANLILMLMVITSSLAVIRPTVGATGEQITMKMPFDGHWAYNVQTTASCGTGDGQTAHPSCHGTNGTDLLGYDWATDYYAANTTPVKVNGSSAQGTVSFSSSTSSGSCGDSLIVTAIVNGVTVGQMYVTHLDGSVVSSNLSNESQIGTIHLQCFGVNHVHFSYKNNVSNHACYVNYSNQTYTAGMFVAYGSNIGVLGSSNTGVQQVCSPPPPPPPAHWIGLAGDWTHKGYDSIGLFNPNTNIFYLRNSNTPGDADTTVAYGNHGWLPIVGDWDGNGTDTVGLYDPTTATFYLRNSNTAGNADVPPFTFGSGGNWVPLVGDWDGNGTTTVGVYDPTTARFYLRNSNNAGNWDYSAVLGNGGSWIPIVGDWDGNGSTTIGVDNTASTFYLSNSNTSGIADVPAFTYANSVWLPVMGNWDGNGNTTTTVGVYDHAGSTFYLRNSNTTGNADITVPYGNPN
jgi:hypothetical protein